MQETLKSLDDMTEAEMRNEARQYVEMTPVSTCMGRRGLASINQRRPEYIWDGDVLGLRTYLQEKRDLGARGILAA